VLVMIANNTGREAQRLLERFPDRIGHIYGPDGWRGPWPNYALDNGAYPAHTKGHPFNEPAFYKLLFRAEKSPTPPRWVAVPDVVADREATLRLWQRWHLKVRCFGWPLVADVIFVGGSTGWKRATAGIWCQAHPRVHIGRVNGEKDLWRYHRLGAESCDGTGWFRGDRRQLDGLWYYLADSEGLNDVAHGPLQPRFALA
jgi:hypothetical protein